MSLFQRTTLITVGCLALLAGLGLARITLWQLPPIFLYISPLLFIAKKKNLRALLIVIVFGLLVGLWRGGEYVSHLNDLKSLTNKSQTIIAEVTADAIYGKNQQLEFTVKNVQLAGNQKQIYGSFKIAGFGPTMVYRGDSIQATGKIYLTRGSNQAGISFAQISVVGQDSSMINKLTRKLSAGMETALPEPMASFGLGLLVGQRSTLSQEVLDQLRLVGLLHIVAVSGYNLTIIVRAMSRLKLGSKYQQLIVSLSLIVGFIFITGFSASIVRASIVSVLSLWAWYYGRKIRSILLLSFTAGLTAFINPFYIWGDIGWYLSFLAFFGILIVSPLLLKTFLKRQPKFIGSVIIETLCAELMTLPLIMATFGQLSLVALVANVLAVPLVPVAMLLSAVAMGFGAYLPQLAGWFAWPAKELLMYMLDVVHILANLPFANKQLAISWASLAIIYFMVLVMILGLIKRSRIMIRKI